MNQPWFVQLFGIIGILPQTHLILVHWAILHGWIRFQFKFGICLVGMFVFITIRNQKRNHLPLIQMSSGQSISITFDLLMNILFNVKHKVCRRQNVTYPIVIIQIKEEKRKSIENSNFIYNTDSQCDWKICSWRLFSMK